jgi:hypothetical protein
MPCSQLFLYFKIEIRRLAAIQNQNNRYYEGIKTVNKFIARFILITVQCFDIEEYLRLYLKHSRYKIKEFS